MRPTVLLFDIDGTLVTTGGVGRRALERAFERLYGRTDACAGFRMDGMTDRAIVRLALRAIGTAATDAAVDSVLPAYLQVLAEEVSGADLSRYRVHPGMWEAVERALGRGAAVGLGTGNIREGARLKLQRVNLFECFQFGGFGCDSEDRTELIRCGASRGAQRLGLPLAEVRVVVVGDTPKDVMAARGIGAECVGVATGSFQVDQLLASGATWAFPTLEHPSALSALLG
jgi:phosphoglycolate phosphatase